MSCSLKAIGIHQPNFFPWPGYFYKIYKSDEFIFLDDVQYSKQSYTGRTKLSIDKKEKWLNLPIDKVSSTNINKVFLKKINWKENHLNIFENYYRKAPYYSEVYDYLQNLYFEKDDILISEFNIRCIKSICENLKFETRFFNSSDIETNSINDLRLCELVLAKGGHIYLSGSGGQNYQSEATFQNAGLKLQLLNYKPTLIAHNDVETKTAFSILDVLFKFGWKNTAEICKSNIN